MQKNPSAGRNPFLLSGLAFAIYLLLTLALTYPLILHFGTHVPGSDTWAFDEYTFVYNQWWFKYALLDLGVNPLYSSYIWVPVGINFVLYTYTLFNAALSLPLQTLLSLPAASNVLLIFSTATSAYGAYLLLRYLLRERIHAGRLSPQAGWWAALLGGALYAFATNRFIYMSLGHYDMVSTEWLPLFTLFLLKTFRERRWINPVLAGLFAAFAMLCEMIYGVFLALLALILFLFEVWPGKHAGVRGRAGVSLIGRLAVLGGAAGVAYGPVLIAVLREMRKGYILSGWGDAGKLSADLLSFVTPGKLNPIFGNDWIGELAAVRQGIARFADVNTVTIGWVALGLAILAGALYWRQVRAWAIAALTFGVLTLGPLLQINGKSLFNFDGLQVTFPLPFILLHYLPIAKGNRAPNRNSVILMLAVAVLAGFAISALLERLPRRRRNWTLPVCSALLAGLLLLEHLSIPLPITDARVPAFYQQLAAEPGDFTLLTLPLGWRDSFGVLGAEDTRTQYYQTVHHKRLISGNSGRHEAFKKDYFAGLPLFQALSAIQQYQPVDAETERLAAESAPALAYLYDLRYVVVHPPVAGRPPYADTWPAAEAFVQRVLPLEARPLYDQDGLRVYRVLQPPAQNGFDLDLGAAGWELYRGEGWHSSEEIGGRQAAWAGAQDARLFLPLREVKERQLNLSAWPFDFAGAAPQTLELRLNGQPLGPALPLAAGWVDYSWTVPAAAQKIGLNELTLHFGRLDSPRAVLPSQRAIGSTGIETPVDIELNSTGPQTGDFAYITLGNGSAGVDGSTHRRGYNLAVLDPQSGVIVQQAAFDTAANSYEADGMANFLASVPQGQIVVVAMRGDGARFLTDRAVEGLRSIGSGVDPRQDVGRSHALVGVKGAPAGSAAEAWSAGQAWLRLGSNPDDRILAAAVDSLSLH